MPGQDEVDERERPVGDVSEPLSEHEILCLAVVVEHLAVEPFTSRAMLGTAQRSLGKLAGRRTDDRPLAIVHGDVETQIAPYLIRLLPHLWP